MQTPATVYLVGAGPGDPGLLTVKAAELLKSAHAVVYDYLANPELLKLCPPTAKQIYVGKSASQHTKTQDQINAILVELAHDPANHPAADNPTRQPRPIVRLKGGDPYVFGRGGEEAEHLRQHNIPFEEVPGITSGIAAPAYAGIPVTHRDFTSTITLITGHQREKSEAGRQKSEELPEDSRVNYDALAKLNGTLVFYMGVTSLPTIATKLLAAGLDPTTPAAVIRWGTRTNQQTVAGTVSTIVDIVKAAGITAPAITVVGQVVSLRQNLNWFESRPLFGKRILVTRTRQQASELSQRLTDLGARVIEAPTIEIAEPQSDAEWEPLDKTLQQLPAYDWVVFTSANGVRAAWQRLRHLTFDARHFGASSIAAVGSATAKALEEIGIIPDVLPEKFMGEELAAAIKTHIGEDEIKGQRFLLLRADIARPALKDELLKMGAIVEDLAIYQTRRPTSLPEEVTAALSQTGDDTLDWITFTSGSTASNLWELLSPDLRQKVAALKKISIGPITTASLEKLGAGEWKPTTTSQQADIDGIIKALLDANG